MPHSPQFRLAPAKILVPLDFSPSSYSALDAAADLAKEFHAELHLLHIVPMLMVGSGPYYTPDTSSPEEASVQAERRLSLLADDLRLQGIKAGVEAQIGNDIVGNVMLALKTAGADMMVLSTHGTSGWHAVVFGSIAEKLIKLIRCPLLLLHTPMPAHEAESARIDRDHAEQMSITSMY